MPITTELIQTYFKQITPASAHKEDNESLRLQLLENLVAAEESDPNILNSFVTILMGIKIQLSDMLRIVQNSANLDAIGESDTPAETDYDYNNPTLVMITHQTRSIEMIAAT